MIEWSHLTGEGFLMLLSVVLKRMINNWSPLRNRFRRNCNDTWIKFFLQHLNQYLNILRTLNISPQPFSAVNSIRFPSVVISKLVDTFRSFSAVTSKSFNETVHFLLFPKTLNQNLPGIYIYIYIPGKLIIKLNNVLSFLHLEDSWKCTQTAW